MKGDFTRDTFVREHHYSRVLMQQGRVQVDADWNEQSGILLHYLRTLGADVIGPHAGPANDAGFEISINIGNLSEEDKARLGIKEGPLAAGDFLIGPGRYYVDGVLCEREHAATYFQQPDFVPPTKPEPEANASYLVFLDVWERHLTAIEAPSIREVALGGPDTASRGQIVAQVKLLKIDHDLDFADVSVDQIVQHRPAYSLEEQRALLHLTLMSRMVVLKTKKKKTERLAFIKASITPLKTAIAARSHRRLRARAFVPQPSLDPCTIQPDARYRGPENQLYRVEIHTPGLAAVDANAQPGTATFKWSRENGSVVFPIDHASESVVRLGHLGKDPRFGLEVGDWVEVVDEEYALQNRSEPLLRVKKIDHLEVTLDGALSAGRKIGKDALLRRWDQKSGQTKMSDGSLVVIEGAGDKDGWITLEDGVQIQFQRPADAAEPNQYRTGDYWLVPARTATGDVEWPGSSTDPRPLPPRGVHHAYAPLARIALDGNARVQALADADDLRLTFDTLA